MDFYAGKTPVQPYGQPTVLQVQVAPTYGKACFAVFQATKTL